MITTAPSIPEGHLWIALRYRMGGMASSAVAHLFVVHECYIGNMRAPGKIATLVPQTFGSCFSRWLIKSGLSGEESGQHDQHASPLVFILRVKRAGFVKIGARELLCNYGYRISYWRKLHMEYDKKLMNPVYRLF